MRESALMEVRYSLEVTGEVLGRGGRYTPSSAESLFLDACGAVLGGGGGNDNELLSAMLGKSCGWREFRTDGPSRKNSAELILLPTALRFPPPEEEDGLTPSSSSSCSESELAPWSISRSSTSTIPSME